MKDLQDTRDAVERDPALQQDLWVVKVHDKKHDWIIRDYVADSKELKDAAAGEPHRARAIKTLEARARSPIEELLLKKLRTSSANLHYSPSFGKIIVIDMR